MVVGQLRSAGMSFGRNSVDATVDVPPARTSMAAKGPCAAPSGVLLHARPIVFSTTTTTATHHIRTTQVKSASRTCIETRARRDETTLLDMCAYDIPLVHWLFCGHVQSVAAVRPRAACPLIRVIHLAFPAHAPPHRHPPPPHPPHPPLPDLAHAPCPSATYHSQPVPVPSLCPSCTWTDYYRRLDLCRSGPGPDPRARGVVAVPERPAFLVPLYACMADGRWELVGMGRSPTYVEGAERVARWVAGQRVHHVARTGGERGLGGGDGTIAREGGQRGY
ncbi:hypothetical protein C8Q76DRAFT_62070 [Earliella scabrosa]|nr:hypothetical protein C8Q76DRAFT_62070 [Earliella scabrosa]